MATVNADAALSGGAFLRMSVTEGTQDVAANTSPDSWSLTLYKGSFSSFNLDGVAYSASVNGSVVSSGSYTFDFRSSTSKLIASGTVTVTHNADGTKTTAFSGYTADTETSSGGPATASGNLVQTTIPRATVPTLSNSSRQIGQTTTITLDRASSSFTHDITYSFGSLTAQTSGLSASTGVATSATFTVPQALVSEMVGQSSKTLTFTVVTKDSGGTAIGSKKVQLTVTPAGGTTYQRPTVSVSVARALSDGTPDDDGTCAKVSIDAAVTSVLISTEQNTLTWTTEVSSDNGSSWDQLGTGTVTSHGLTLDSDTTYTDSDPVTGGTQEFATTSGYLFRVTITDNYSNSAVQVIQMSTAAAIFDFYDGGGDPAAAGVSVGALFDVALGRWLQINGHPVSDMRLSFATKSDLTGFTGWAGLHGFVDATNTEYIWISGAWKLWAAEYESFTPSWSSGMTFGNGVVNFARYTVTAGRMVTVSVRVTLGTTSAVTGAFGISLPVGSVDSTNIGSSSASAPVLGHGTLRDASASTNYDLAVILDGDTSTLLRVFDASGTYLKRADVTNTVPVAGGLANPDRIWFQFTYQTQDWIAA